MTKQLCHILLLATLLLTPLRAQASSALEARAELLSLRLDAAEKTARAVLRQASRSKPVEAEALLRASLVIARVESLRGKALEAEGTLKDARNALQKAVGETHPLTQIAEAEFTMAAAITGTMRGARETLQRLASASTGREAEAVARLQLAKLLALEAQFHGSLAELELARGLLNASDPWQRDLLRDVLASQANAEAQSGSLRRPRDLLGELEALVDPRAPLEVSEFQLARARSVQPWFGNELFRDPVEKGLAALTPEVSPASALRIRLDTFRVLSELEAADSERAIAIAKNLRLRFEGTGLRRSFLRLEALLAIIEARAQSQRPEMAFGSLMDHTSLVERLYPEESFVRIWGRLQYAIALARAGQAASATSNLESSSPESIAALDANPADRIQLLVTARAAASILGNRPLVQRYEARARALAATDSRLQARFATNFALFDAVASQSLLDADRKMLGVEAIVEQTLSAPTFTTLRLLDILAEHSEENAEIDRAVSLRSEIIDLHRTYGAGERKLAELTLARAWTHLEFDNAAAALADIELARPVAMATKDGLQHALRLATAIAHLQRDDLASAEVEARAALALFEEMLSNPVRDFVVTHQVLAAVLFRQERLEEARKTLEAALPRAAFHGLTGLVRELQEARKSVQLRIDIDSGKVSVRPVETEDATARRKRLEGLAFRGEVQSAEREQNLWIKAVHNRNGPGSREEEEERLFLARLQLEGNRYPSGLRTVEDVLRNTEGKADREDLRFEALVLAARLMADSRRPEEAEKFLAAAEPFKRLLSGTDSEQMLRINDDYAVAHSRTQRPLEAVPYVQECRRLGRVLGRGAVFEASSTRFIVVLLARAGKLEDARREWSGGGVGVEPKTPSYLRAALEALFIDLVVEDFEAARRRAEEVDDNIGFWESQHAPNYKLLKLLRLALRENPTPPALGESSLRSQFNLVMDLGFEDSRLTHVAMVALAEEELRRGNAPQARSLAERGREGLLNLLHPSHSLVRRAEAVAAASAASVSP